MSVYWFFAIGIVAIRIGIPLALAGLITVLLKRPLSAKGIGTFASFGIALAGIFILQTVAIWRSR
jgi:hypothetical protein